MNQQSVTYHKLEVALGCPELESIHCRKQLQNWLQLRVRHHQASRRLQWQYTPVFHSDDLVTNCKHRACSDTALPDLGELLKRRKQEQSLLANGLNQQN